MNLILLSNTDESTAQVESSSGFVLVDEANLNPNPNSYTLPAKDRRTKHIVNHLKAVGSTVKVGIKATGQVGIADVKTNPSGDITLIVRDLAFPPHLPSIDLIIGMPHPDAIRKVRRGEQSTLQSSLLKIMCRSHP